MERPKQHSIPTISGDATFASLGIFDFMNHRVPDVSKDTLDKNWQVPYKNNHSAQHQCHNTCSKSLQHDNIDHRSMQLRRRLWTVDTLWEHSWHTLGTLKNTKRLFDFGAFSVIDNTLLGNYLMLGWRLNWFDEISFPATDVLTSFATST